ncbi:MAG: FHA domain-containing protein, partial [Lachnospiraceae bacterium]|nr:FHA domain-containing protein [Lachnospiraceae bacterium]
SNPWDAPAQDNSNPWDAPAQNSVKPSDPWSTPAQNDSKPSDPWSTGADSGRMSLSKSSAPEKQTDFVDLENELTTFPEDEKTIGADVFGTIVGTVGTFEGQSFPIYDGEVLVIGRNSQMSQLVIPSPDISRKHCAVRYSGAENAYYVTDYSSVGTFCKGGGRIPAGQEIKYEAGTEISLGSGKNAFLLK